MKNPWIVIGVIMVVLIGGSVWYSSTVGAKNNEGITFTSHVKGGENAAVTLVEYSDFQCPACGSFQPILKEVMTEFGDQVKLEYKHFPLPIHKMAQPAARAAEAAGQQGAFFEFHDLLFKNQTVWSTSPNPMVYFTEYATELNLDLDLFKKHYNASAISDKISEQVAEGRALSITGTPTFFLNGEKMKIETYQDFRDQVAAALGITSGTTTTPTEIKFGI